jgi:hypothetical protein
MEYYKMNNYLYSQGENMSTNQIFIFQLCTELSTVSTEQIEVIEIFRIRHI